MNALNLLESERHAELDVGSGVGVVGKFLVIVETVVLCTEAESLVPLHTGLLPLLEVFEFGAWLNEELHFHLLKLAHTEDELTCNNLVTESLTNLSDTERNLHTASLLNVEIVDEDALSSLRTQIYLHCAFRSRTHFGREHEVELAYVGPVLGAADGVNDFLVRDNLLQLGKIRTLHSLGITFVQSVALLLVLYNACVGGTELSLVERVAETLACLGNLLLNLLIILCYLILDENVGTVALL